MATYIYQCKLLKHSREVSHAMAESPIILCDVCGEKMHRVPQVVNVVWQGLPPSEAIRRSPAVQKLIDTAPERRAKFLDTERKK